MTKLLWRIQFAFAVRKIFSRPKGAFTGNHLALGWRMSGKEYEDYKGMEPYQAALDVITEWYS